MSIHNCIAAALTLAIIAPHALAAVEVTYFNTVGTQLNTVSFAENAPVAVTLNPNIGSVRVVVVPVPSQGDIGEITVTGSANGPVTLFVTTNLDFGGSPPTTSGARNLAGLNDLSGLVRFKGRLTGDLTGPISTTWLVYLYVGDEIQQTIHVAPRRNPH
jgi:hypothetical protein